MTLPTVLTTCLVYIVVYLVAVSANPIDEETLNALPQAIRQSPSTIVRVLNSSDTLPEEAMANISSTLSNTSFSDIENDNLTHSLQLRYRERKKQERIIKIQAQILHSLRMNRQPNISAPILSEDEQKKIAIIFERMQQSSNNGHMEMAAQGIADPFLSKLQSFYPSCSLPNNTDRTLWESNNGFRIYYDPQFNRYSGDSEISIILAKLRLYKMARNSDPNFIGANLESLPRYNQLESLINTRAAHGINVAVYQYIKPMRPNKREKKRLVDSKIIPVDYEGWIEFNVISSLNYWLHHNNKNYGFLVEVDDAYGNKLNPNLYFQNINCSSEIPAQDPPFPNIMELHPDMGENESSLFDNETYPTLDLQTAEIPRDFSEIDALAGRLNDRIIRKRSNRHQSVESCQEELVYVTFAEMGLDSYILWPEGVLWTFCEGSCNSESDIEDRKKSFVSSWMHRLFHIKLKESESSCIVTNKESMSIIFYDGENSLYETVIEDIVPTSCGCQTT